MRFEGGFSASACVLPRSACLQARVRSSRLRAPARSVQSRDRRAIAAPRSRDVDPSYCTCAHLHANPCQPAIHPASRPTSQPAFGSFRQLAGFPSPWARRTRAAIGRFSGPAARQPRGAHARDQTRSRASTPSREAGCPSRSCLETADDDDDGEQSTRPRPSVHLHLPSASAVVAIPIDLPSGQATLHESQHPALSCRLPIASRTARSTNISALAWSRARQRRRAAGVRPPTSSPSCLRAPSRSLASSRPPRDPSPVPRPAASAGKRRRACDRRVYLSTRRPAVLNAC